MACDARGVCASDPRPRRTRRCFRHNRVITPRRLAAFTLAAALIAAALASSAFGAIFFLFKPTSAKPGDLVTVRLGGTPANFTLAQRKRPFQEPIRLYLLPNSAADKIRTRFDGRLSFIGQLAPDANTRGILSFVVPPLDSDTYVVAAWCPGCAKYSFGRRLFVLSLPEVSRYRDLMALRVQMPTVTETCPVTIPRGGKPPPSSAASPEWHGNGFLWTRLAQDGVFAPPPENVGWPGDPKGSIGTKLYWFARIGGIFTLKGQRLDAPSSPLVVHSVNRGQSDVWRGPTWATAVTFPSQGCWRLTARVEDISLTFVLKVDRR